MVRIAVVEDEAFSRHLLADYLVRYSEENGRSFEVTYFEDGGAIIGDYKPVYDIILMDIQMTHVDGMTAARAIREVDQEVVLVFITSAAQFAIHGYQVGALSYLMKPLPWFAFSQELSRCLEAVAKRRGAARRRSRQATDQTGALPSGADGGDPGRQLVRRPPQH